MKFNFKNRGFVVLSLSAMLIAVGVINYQLSKQSALTVSKEFEAYEQAQQDKIQMRIVIKKIMIVIAMKIVTQVAMMQRAMIVQKLQK